MVEINVATRTASLTQRESGVSDDKSPGQHLVNIRMIWLPMPV